MVLNRVGQPLELRDCPTPQHGPREVLVKVLACGVCRTDLHLVDGELPNTKTPIIPGHEIVGEIVSVGADADASLKNGTLVGIPWLGWTCGTCEYCLINKENLCNNAKFTGYQLNGGYSEYTRADHRYCIPLDFDLDAAKLAPLLCAGLIGYRSLKMAQTMIEHVKKIGIFGFGAAAHILAQVIIYQGQSFYAFTRPGDVAAQQFAYDLGATWSGDSGQQSPDLLDAAIIFAPIGSLVPVSLRMVRKGGVVVCGGIHMSKIPSFPYNDLWGERKICSVANLTRQDGLDFFDIVKQASIQTHIQKYNFADANQALNDLRSGRVKGAAVLTF